MKYKQFPRKELYDKWIAALRSGNYKQTTGVLKDDCGFCCLGVLCDIVKDDDEKWTKYCRDMDYILYDGMTTYDLPGDLKDYMNISDSVQSSLINMNDDGDDDFESIADFIEKQVKPVLVED